MKKTLKKQFEEQLGKPFHGHPSRSNEERIAELEKLVLRLAEQVDILIEFAVLK